MSREKSCRFPGTFSAWSPILHPSGPKPSSLDKPPGPRLPSLPGQIASLRSPRSTLLPSKKMPNLAALQPALPPERAEAPPPANSRLEGPAPWAEGQRSGRGQRRLATSTKESACSREARPRPFPVKAKWATRRTRPGELQLLAGVGAPCPTTSSCLQLQSLTGDVFLFPFLCPQVLGKGT